MRVESEVAIATVEPATYRACLASFDAGYREMKASSGSLARIAAEFPTGMSDCERRLQIAKAAGEFEAAREVFLSAAAKLNQFLLAHLISPRPVM